MGKRRSGHRPRRRRRVRRRRAARDLHRAPHHQPVDRQRARTTSSSRSRSTSARTPSAASRWTPPTASSAAWRSRTPARPIPMPVGPRGARPHPQRRRRAGRRGAARSTPSKSLPIHRAAPTFVDQAVQRRDVRDRHQGHRPARPLPPRRQDRPVRRRRRRQDRAHHGAHQQRRQEARRLLGVRRRRRAHPRGQRPLPRDGGVEAVRRRRRSSRRPRWSTAR